MKQRKYEEMILQRIEKNFDVLIPFGAVIALISGIVILFGNIPSEFAAYDIGLSIFLLFLFAFRKRVHIKQKIGIIAFLLFLLGSVSILSTGFAGTGIQVLIVGSILVIGFLPMIYGVFFTVLICSFLVAVPIALNIGWLHYDGNNAYLHNDPTEWVIHLLSFIILNVILMIIINSIKIYLTQTIYDTENYMEELSQFAFYDQLTGLPNKNKFFESIEKDRISDAILVVFNIKGLTLVNSIYGDQKGDEILIFLAKNMKKHIVQGEYIARTNATEFAWFFPGHDEERMKERIDMFVNKVLESERELGIQSLINFYGAYVMIDQTLTDPNICYQKVLIALEYAKLKKSNTLYAYDFDVVNTFRRNERIKNLIVSAINNRDFIMHYQEKKDIKGERTLGVEALARWYSNELGPISPGVFIPIVAKSNKIIEFGNMILSLVLEDYPKICATYGEDVSVSINISPHHMLAPNFVDELVIMFDRISIPKHKIIFEITEEVIFENISDAINVISALRSHGFKIALDDFGTGYSSLSYLASLDVDEVKIDRSFIVNIEKNFKNQALIKAILNLKDTHGFSVVVEGVETKEQCAVLEELGCEIIQGYLYSKPKGLL